VLSSSSPSLLTASGTAQSERSLAETNRELRQSFRELNREPVLSHLAEISNAWLGRQASIDIVLATQVVCRASDLRWTAARLLLGACKALQIQTMGQCGPGSATEWLFGLDSEE
jgi:hypothetical protein